MRVPVNRLSVEELRWLGTHTCGHGHTFLSHYNCYLRDYKKHERIGCIDIETSNLSANFGIMLSWAIKPLHKKPIFDVITQEDLDQPEDFADKRILESCVAAMRQFDRMVGHYSSRFDIPYIRTRCIRNKVDFPKHRELVQTDTWRLARDLLKLSSNRQGVVGDLITGKNIKTAISSRYWLKALQGDPDALAYIVDHNLKDVKQLEKNYLCLVQFQPNNNRSI